MVYARPEDEYFHKHADWSYTFPVANRPTEKDELRQLRIVMCLKPAKLKAARYIRLIRLDMTSSLIHMRQFGLKGHTLILHLAGTGSWLSVVRDAMRLLEL